MIKRLSLVLVGGLSVRAGPVSLSGAEDLNEFLTDEVDGTSSAVLYFSFTTELQGVVETLGDDREDLRLMIFVDDLDRCLHEGMFQTMEMMKVFFDIPGVTFVVGVSRAALLEAVATHYGEDLETDSIVRADLYLDRIFQVGVSVHVSTLKLLEVFFEATQFPLGNPEHIGDRVFWGDGPALTPVSSNTS